MPIVEANVIRPQALTPKYLYRSTLAVLLLAATVLVGSGLPVRAQSATPPAATPTSPCGIVDAIDYPVDGVSIEHDDFGMYRAGFDGFHSGIDMAFDRYGDPVRAAAIGRVTYSDPNGWDTEKGVVIIEHTFPDGSIFFSLYGHMEETNGHTFPNVGECVVRGQIVGSVGHPSRGAPHLHYEIRTFGGNTGGPGYWSVDPLDGGWLHPIDFTEQWRLRFSAAFRKMATAGTGPTAPPIWNADGTVTFAEESHIEQRDAQGQTQWRLDVQGLNGLIGLPDGHILGSTTDNQIMLVDRVNARFSASWQPDRILRSPPIRLGDSIVFLGDDNRAVSYNEGGTLLWQTDPLGSHVERYVQSGTHLAVSARDGDAFKLSVIDPNGKVLYQANAPVPITPVAGPGGSFIVMVGSQVALLKADLTSTLLLDVGQALGRDSQIALDPTGNVILYPGSADTLYAYNASGGLRWTAKLPGMQVQPPLVGVGAGCLDYALTADGQLLTYRAADGALRGSVALYAGGTHGHTASRFLHVSADDQVQFSAGYLSIATIDGPTLANACKP